MDAATKKATVKRYYDEIWSQGKVEQIQHLMHPDYENCDPATPGGKLKGRDAFRGLITTYREAMPDLVMKITQQWCEGDVVISRWYASGTQKGALMGIPPTGKRAEAIEGVTITEFSGDRIIRDSALWDQAGLLRLLGVLPG